MTSFFHQLNQVTESIGLPETYAWDITRLDPLEVEQALEKAIDIYHGDLLPDSYDDWILAHREQLRQRYLGALEQLMDLLVYYELHDDMESAIIR